MAKYLDDKGLKTFTTKMKGYADGKVGEVDKKVTSHIGSTQNPHKVTKEQVGLGKVTDDPQIPLSQKGVANGVATLGADGKLTSTQMPVTKTINGESIFGTGNITVSASLYKIVDALPTKDIDITKIYLVPASATTVKNNKTEYIYLGDPNKAYDESKWEKLGDEQKSSTVTTPGGTITVDTALIENSPNPVAGGVVKAKVDEIDTKLANKVESSTYNTKMTTIDSKLKTLENKTIDVDAELGDTSNPVQNRAVNAAVLNLNTAIGKKANSTDLNAATGKITTLETNAATILSVTGEGNGISSISKSGNTITAKKATFLTSAAGLATKNDILPDTLASKGIATKTWVNEQGFVTGTIPTKVSELKNDSGFLTTHQSLDGYVNEVQPDGASGNGIAGITKDGKILKVTKATFLTEHQSLAEYVNDVKLTEVTKGNGIASIEKIGKSLKVTQGAFLTGTSEGTLYEEETQTENGKGIVDIFLRGNMLCKRKGTFVTPATLGTAIESYVKDKKYLTKEDMKETVVIKLVSDKSASDTNLNGATVVVKSGDTTVSTQTWQGTPIKVEVPCDKDVTIEAGVKKMYIKPKALTYIPSPLYNREVTFTYKALNTGTYIIDKNDNLYKTADLLQASGVAYDDTLGVLLVTDSIAIVIARTVLNEKAWSTGTGLVEGCTTTTDSSTAIKDFAGAANTSAIIKKHNALDEAAASCNRYIFKNGKKGYLMSVGEALAIQANIDTIGRLLVDIDTGNGNVMSDSGYYWTSTQYDASKAYYVRMNSRYPSSSLKDNKRAVVPIYSLYD